MSTVGGVALFLTSVPSVVAAWVLWTRAQRRLRYDLKDIPGPKQQPLIGNLRSVLGSSYLHKVSRSLCMQSRPHSASVVRLALRNEPSKFDIAELPHLLPSEITLVTRSDSAS